MADVSKSEPKRDANIIGRGKAGPGRPKGSQTKVGIELRKAALDAAAAAGGKGGLIAYLQKQAKDNPAPFLSFLGRCLPKTLEGADGGDITIKVITGLDREAGSEQ